MTFYFLYNKLVPRTLEREIPLFSYKYIYIYGLANSIVYVECRNGVYFFIVYLLNSAYTEILQHARYTFQCLLVVKVSQRSHDLSTKGTIF